MIMRETGLFAVLLEKMASAKAPSSHCYGMRLDTQVNRSSTTVGGRKNANRDAYPPETHLKKDE